MAVMNKMREMTKGILYLLVLAFVGTIIFDWGMSYSGKKAQANVVGEVDGIEISLREFDTNLSNQMQQYRGQAGGDLQDSQIDFIRNQVWNSMVQQTLIQRTLEDKGISVANAEIVYRLFNDPPEVLRSNPSFQNEQKQFDMAMYQAALNDPSTAEQWRPIEEYLRQSLRVEKLQQQLQASVRVTSDEIKREYLNRNQNAKVEYVFVNPRSFDAESIDITDEMVESYYKTHQEDYLQPEQRAIEYIVFSTEPTAADSAATRDEAKRVFDRAKAGDDFGDLAETYSEDLATSSNGGLIDFFAKGVQAQFSNFENDLFFADKNDVVGPFESNTGVHLFKIEDKRKQDNENQIKVRHISFKFEPSRKTANQAREDADYVAEQSPAQDFQELATEVGDSVRTTGLFVKGIFVPGIGRNQRIMDFTFANKINSVGAVLEIDRGFLVYRVSDVKQESTKPLDEVRGLVRNKILADRRMEKAGEVANNVYQKIQEGASLQDASAIDTLEIKETAEFARSGSVAGVGRDTNFIGAAFALKQVGDISKPVEGTRGYYLLRLVEKDEFDASDFESKKAQISAQLKQLRESQVFGHWYAELKENAEIKDYRARFYN